MKLINRLNEIITKIRLENPLVHHITNYVTANDCANAVLAIGGSPVMADSLLEVEEITSMASALVLNIGTLNKEKVDSFLLAGKQANKLGIPVVLDPVGVGATSLRNNAIREILNEVNISVLKGNMSEIKNIYGIKTLTKGVDSIESPLDGGIEIAKDLANILKCTVAITGKVDIVSNGEKVYFLNNGHGILSRITGTGCMSSSLIGACCGVGGDSIYAAVAGISIMSIAGEKAFSLLNAEEGLGTFRVYLMDAIGNFSNKDFKERGKINEIQ